MTARPIRPIWDVIVDAQVLQVAQVNRFDDAPGPSEDTKALTRMQRTHAHLFSLCRSVAAAASVNLEKLRACFRASCAGCRRQGSGVRPCETRLRPEGVRARCTVPGSGRANCMVKMKVWNHAQQPVTVRNACYATIWACQNISEDCKYFDSYDVSAFSCSTLAAFLFRQSESIVPLCIRPLHQLASRGNIEHLSPGFGQQLGGGDTVVEVQVLYLQVLGLIGALKTD